MVYVLGAGLAGLPHTLAAMAALATVSSNAEKVDSIWGEKRMKHNIGGTAVQSPKIPQTVVSSSKSTRFFLEATNNHCPSPSLHVPVNSRRSRPCH